MGKVDKNTLKKWFKRGAKPNEDQFESLIDSMIHKDEGIALEQMPELIEALDEKAPAEHGHGNYLDKTNPNLEEGEAEVLKKALNIKDGAEVIDEIVPEEVDKAVNSQAVMNWSIQKINTMAELRKTVGKFEGQVVELIQYYDEVPAPAVKYKWTTKQGVDDGGSCIVITDEGSWDALISELPLLSPKMFGAKHGGTEDCTDAFLKIIDLGKVVDVSNNTYKITSIDRPNFKIYGYNYELSKIITAPTTEEKIVFTNPRNGKVQGVYFEPIQADTQYLFKRDGAFSCVIKDNYFKEYHTVFDFQTNGNGMEIKDNYFYRGLYGVRGVLAHACYINNNRFRQQKVFSLDMQSGTGSDMKSNHFMAAIGMPSTIRILGMQSTFEDNYFEAYTGIEGELNDVAIIIEFNYAAHMPVFRNNRFNLKNLFKYGVEFSGGSTVNTKYIDWQKNSIDGFTISHLKNPLNKFRNVNIKESLGYINFVRHGFKAVHEMDLSSLTTSLVKVPIYNSNMLLDNGSKAISDDSNFGLTFYEPGVKYLLKMRMTYSTAVENSGVILSYRRVGVTPTMIEIREPNIVSNKTVEFYKTLTPADAAAMYNIDFRKIADAANLSNVILEVEFNLI
ncbi:MAG: hypothetical protein ACRC8Z_04845 [Empedobacter falsenii]